jgi:ribosomal protein S18 acetylase RimI-like enzyme
MEDLDDDELYRRGTATLLGSWAEYARRAQDAELVRLRQVTAAVFAREPERDVYNNAVLAPALDEVARSAALEAMEAVYAAAGVERFAAWVEEGDAAMRRDLERRGYTLDTSTLAMGMILRDLIDARLPPGVEVGPATWEEYVASEGFPSTFLRTADHEVLHVLVAREDGEIVAAALAYDLAGDCGIYNVSTKETARRRGLGTALTAVQVRAARERGCRTASLQSTAVGEGVYRRVGFRDLRRILEYIPRGPW